MLFEAKDLKGRVGQYPLHFSHLQADAGEILCVMGSSGSGKSSLLGFLVGFLAMESGTIELAGVRLEDLPPERRGIAIVFQQPSLFTHLNLRENIEFGLKIQKVPEEERTKRVSPWIEKMGLQGLEERYPEELSGGQLQRAEIARALVTGFRLLLLDEPFSGLDVSLRKQMRTLLKERVKEAGISAVLVSHDPQDAEELGAHVVVLENGSVVQSGTLSEIRRSPASPGVRELVS